MVSLASGCVFLISKAKRERKWRLFHQRYAVIFSQHEVADLIARVSWTNYFWSARNHILDFPHQRHNMVTQLNFSEYPVLISLLLREQTFLEETLQFMCPPTRGASSCFTNYWIDVSVCSLAFWNTRWLYDILTVITVTAGEWLQTCTFVSHSFIRRSATIMLRDTWFL